MRQPSRLLPVGAGRRTTSLGSHGWPTARNRRFGPKTVSSPLPPLHRPDPEGTLRVDMARSPSHRRTSGRCAKQTYAVKLENFRLGSKFPVRIAVRQ